MILTLILALCFILVILLMLYAAVAMVQDKSLFGSAPKDIVDAIQPREERFKGARFLGWSLIILSMLILVAVAVIGICHPAVIKMEYYLGKKSWWIWLVVGVLVACASLFVPNQTVSTILGGFAFSCFWGILEMHQQEQRVVKGWFPENPKRHDYYEALRLKRPR